MKSCRTPGGYSKGGTGYPWEAPYASASGPMSENTGPDSAKPAPSRTSIDRNKSTKRRIMLALNQQINGLIRSLPALPPYHRLKLMSDTGAPYRQKPAFVHVCIELAGALLCTRQRKSGRSPYRGQ